MIILLQIYCLVCRLIFFWKSVSIWRSYGRWRWLVVDCEWSDSEGCCGVQLTLRDLTNHEPTVHELNDAVESIVSRSSGAEHSSVVNKQRELNDMYSVVQVLARDQTHLLRDKYRHVSQFVLSHYRK